VRPIQRGASSFGPFATPSDPGSVAFQPQSSLGFAFKSYLFSVTYLKLTKVKWVRSSIFDFRMRRRRNRDRPGRHSRALTSLVFAIIRLYTCPVPARAPRVRRGLLPTFRSASSVRHSRSLARGPCPACCPALGVVGPTRFSHGHRVAAGAGIAKARPKWPSLEEIRESYYRRPIYCGVSHRHHLYRVTVLYFCFGRV
jgi:hypothetical protein